jgi:iron(III) transport system ATP-binding protein
MGTLVGVLRQGTLAQLSAPEVLYHRPVTADLASFVGEAVFFPGIAGNGKVHCALGDLQLADATATGPVEVMIRPEQVKIIFAPIQNSVQAIIQNVTFYGHDAVVRLSLPCAATGCDVTARVFTHALPKSGSDVWLTVEGEVVAYAEPIVA